LKIDGLFELDIITNQMAISSFKNTLKD